MDKFDFVVYELGELLDLVDLHLHSLSLLPRLPLLPGGDEPEGAELWHVFGGGGSEQDSILHTLRTHHSHDVQHLAQVSFALRRAVMANQQGAWWCAWCRKDVKAAFNHCGFCGASWQDSARHSGKPKSPRRCSRRKNQDWNYAGGWNEDEDYAQSPRTRPQSPRQAPAPPKKAPAKAAKEKKQNKNYQTPAKEPDWNPKEQYESTTASSANQGKAELLLQELASSIKTSDQPIDPKVQTILAKVNIKPPDPSKQMHSATSRLDNARKDLQKAKEAKRNLHRNWRAFLQDAVRRWESHSEKFQKEDTELQAAIDAAAVVFQEARTVFEQTKEVMTARDQEQTVQEISDEELLADATPNVAEDIQMMLSSLTKIRDRSDEAHLEEESASKKPRREEEDGGLPSQAATVVAPALQPFGKGGR